MTPAELVDELTFSAKELEEEARQLASLELTDLAARLRVHADRLRIIAGELRKQGRKEKVHG